MSSLRSALDEIRIEDLSSLSDDALAARLDEIEHSCRVLEAERARGLAEVDRRRVFAADGHLSTAAWLAHRQGRSRRSAEAAVRRALALEQMPEVARAFGQGEVSASAVQVLASAREAAPGAFEHAEDSLLQAAREMGLAELRATTEAWRIEVDRDRALEDEERRHEHRRLDVCPDAVGMISVQGELDAEDGQCSSPPSGRRWTPRRARGPGPIPGRPPSAGPTRWARSAAPGWGRGTGPRSAASVPTSW